MEIKELNFFGSDVLFRGFYGQKNTGDDAFVEVVAWGAKKYWGVESAIFLARANRLPITQDRIKGYPLTFPKSYHLQNNILLRNTKYLISAGGSTIHSALTKNNIKTMAVARKIKANNLKLGAIGVSIGPFKSQHDEKAVVDYLKCLDFVAVRDEKSFCYLSQLDLPYKPVNAFDLAALLPNIYGRSERTARGDGKKVIGVSVCPYESISRPQEISREQKRHRMLCELLISIQQKDNVHFKFLVINGHEIIGDFELTKKTIIDAKLESAEIVGYQRETKVMWREVENCDFIITTRLHAAVFACFSDVPFMLNEYHRKCGDFLDTIGYHEPYRLYDSEYSVEDKATMIVETIRQNSFIAPSMKEFVINKAKLNFTGISF